MKRQVQIATFAIVSLAGSVLPGYAQRGGRSLPPRPAPASRHIFSGVVLRPMNGSSSSTTNSTQTTSTFSDLGLLGATPLSLSELLNPVPGDGFDFTHLAAMNRNLGVMALIDPITQGKLAIAERLLRESPRVAGFFPFFGQSEPVVIVQQPPVVVLQQPYSAEAPAADRTVLSQPVAPLPAVEPLPSSGDFILVLKNGTRIAATAFTRQGERIVYITPDGSRLSIPLADLDAAATNQVNETHGAILHLPT